jgi:hypothetical protein
MSLLAEALGPKERAIRDYVNLESPEDDQATLVQKVRSHRILGRTHDVFDVHCTQTRWWVITEPTNLYLQTDFPDAEQALIFHLGLGAFLAERMRREMEEEQEEHVSAAWRRFRDALETMNDASESEDFQSVGIKCRDSLIALARTHQSAHWLGEVLDPPKVADFKGWANIFANCLAEGRLRNYLKALVDKTWDLTVWLQHYSNATPLDADLVLEATSHLIITFGKLIRRQEVGEPDRCPRCDSYRLHNELQHDAEVDAYQESNVCAGCGWRSEWTLIPELADGE